MKDYLILSGYAQPIYKKCDLCKRVKDIHYRLDVKNADAPTMIVGSLDLCKVCAGNFGEILRK